MEDNSSSQLENETIASASSERTGDRSQLAELYCSNMFSMSAPPPITQHSLSLVSFSACTIPSRPVPDQHTAGLNWTVSCKKCLKRGSDSVSRQQRLWCCRRWLNCALCYISVLMRFICSYLQITSNKTPKCRSTKNHMADVSAEVMYGPTYCYMSCTAYTSTMTDVSGTGKKG